MAEAIACNGELVLVEVCAFLNQLMNTSVFRLRAVVYRENGGFSVAYREIMVSNILMVGM